MNTRPLRRQIKRLYFITTKKEGFTFSTVSGSFPRYSFQVCEDAPESAPNTAQLKPCRSLASALAMNRFDCSQHGEFTGQLGPPALERRRPANKPNSAVTIHGTQFVGEGFCRNPSAKSVSNRQDFQGKTAKSVSNQNLVGLGHFFVHKSAKKDGIRPDSGYFGMIRLCLKPDEISLREKKNGRDDWIRTSDLHTPSVALYQAKLRPEHEENGSFPLTFANLHTNSHTR